MGGILLGPIGAVGGAIIGKKGKTTFVCHDCGNTWEVKLWRQGDSLGNSLPCSKPLPPAPAINQEGHDEFHQALGNVKRSPVPQGSLSYKSNLPVLEVAREYRAPMRVSPRERETRGSTFATIRYPSSIRCHDLF